MKQHKDETVPAEAVWHVAYALRATMGENERYIKELRETLAQPADGTPGVLIQSLTGALENSEDLRRDLFDAFATLPEELRPDPKRYPREVAE